MNLARRYGLMAVVLMIGCSGGSSGTPKVDASSNAMDAAPTATCQEIRQCVWYCASEKSEPCVSDCIARGTPQAREAFQVLAACTAPHCPTGETYCGCEQRCFSDGNCIAETEACADGVTDLVCEELCH